MRTNLICLLIVLDTMASHTNAFILQEIIVKSHNVLGKCRT